MTKINIMSTTEEINIFAIDETTTNFVDNSNDTFCKYILYMEISSSG